MICLKIVTLLSRDPVGGSRFAQVLDVRELNTARIAALDRSRTA